MKPSRRWVWACVAVVALVISVGGLGFALAPSLGWATPLSFPSQFTYRGLEYGNGLPFWPGPKCVQQLPRSQRRGILPSRRIGSIFGYFTSSLPILQPRDPGWTSESVGPHPVRLLVRDGGCLRIYMELADLG